MARIHQVMVGGFRRSAVLLMVVGVLSFGVGCSSDSNSGGEDSPDDVGVDTSAPDTGIGDTGSDVGDTGSVGGDDADAEAVDLGPQGEDVSVRSFGAFPPQPASCDAPGERHRIPFYFTTRQGSTIRPIKPGDFLFGEVVQPEQTIGAGTLAARRTQVSQLGREACTSTDDCTGPFKCGSSGVRGAEKRCTRQTGVEFIPGTTEHDFRPNHRDDSGQVIAVLFEHTASYLGALPTFVGSKYDENGEKDLDRPAGRATDPDLRHREALEQFSTFLATAANPANTQVSPWFFGGEFPARAQPMHDPMAMQDHFTDNLELLKDLVANLDGPAPLAGNVYQSILQVIEKDLGIDKYTDHEKFLFLVTDGPNEIFDREATKQKVLTALQEHGIHLFILHLDAQIDPELMRDDQRYWAGNSNCIEDDSCEGRAPCSDDSDCANFETCRKGKIYADEEGGSVRESSLEYCLPDYSDGHLGPIGPYADLACRTGGNYLYTTKPEQMVDYGRRLPFLFDGQWSVEAEFSALDEEVGLEDGFYRFGGAIFGLLGANLGAIFSLPSDTGAIQHTSDTRPLLRLNPDGDGGD